MQHEITAAKALNLYAVPEASYSQVDIQKKIELPGHPIRQIQRRHHARMSSQLPSRLVTGSASTASGWNTLLQGTIFETGLGGADIRVGVGDAARADAAIILEGIKTTITQNVNWQPVQLAYNQWSYDQQGLTPAGAALVGVVVAVATGGAGSSLLSTTSTAGSAMADAALSSLTAQASITLINNGGDISKTLKALGSSDTIKAAVAAQR